MDKLRNAQKKVYAMMPPWLQHWGEGWRWFVYGTLIVIVPFSSLFVLFLWLLKLTPRTWWRSVWGGKDDV